MLFWLALLEHLHFIKQNDPPDEKFKKGCFGCGATIFLLFFTVFFVIPIADYQISLLRIGWRAGIHPTDAALKTYLLEEALVPGISRDEARKRLRATAIRVNIIDMSDRMALEEKETWDYITFWVGYWPLTRFNIFVYYDENLKLTTVFISDEPS